RQADDVRGRARHLPRFARRPGRQTIPFRLRLPAYRRQWHRLCCYRRFPVAQPRRRFPFALNYKAKRVIDNTSASPIAGTFSNLPDGGTFTSNDNTYQVSYEGGDGNDLTLTVLP